MDTIIVSLKFVFFLVLLIFLYSLRGFYLNYRSDLKLKKATSPYTRKTVFYFDGILPPNARQRDFFDKYYDIDSLIIDNNQVYKILDGRPREKEETDKSCIGTYVFDVEKYSINRIKPIAMCNNFRRPLYLLENDYCFIDLSGYEQDMTSILSSLNENESFIERNLLLLLSGHPILIPGALDICSVVSFHLDKQAPKKTALFFFWQDIYCRLYNLNRIDNSNTDYVRRFIMKTLFLSFCSKDKPIADLVENKLNDILGNQIKISRYERDVKYRESFKKFMDTLPEHNFVLIIVSDSYLKSTACLYEVGEVLKDHHFQDKLFFIVLSDNDNIYYNFATDENHFTIEADIYSTDGRLKYFDYWTSLNTETEKK